VLDNVIKSNLTQLPISYIHNDNSAGFVGSILTWLMILKLQHS